MAGVAELVNNGNFLQRVAGWRKDGNVAREGSGVAAYIDNPLRVHLYKRIE